MIALALAVIVSTGAIDMNCTEVKACQDGYTSTVRPPARFTNALKKKQMEERSLVGELGSYEEDHFIPLELCGCPRCPENLWPQLWSEARKKDADETRLHRAVCKGQMTLEEAQEYIREHWKMH